MSTLLKKIKNAYGRLVKKEKRGVLLPAFRTVTGESPSISFDSLVDIYLCDPAARAAVDFLADQTVGTGFYTTAEDADAPLTHFFELSVTKASLLR